MRIAVIPITAVGERERANTDELDTTEMVLERNGRRYSEAVVTALNRQLFTEAFLLEPPASPTAEASVEPDWTALAEQQGADAILSMELAANPQVMEADNSNYYLNFLLFTIGGPFCWWLKDHTYDVEAKLSADLYDLPRLRRERAAPGSEDSVLARISDAAAPSERMDMSFGSRADGDVGKYCLSVVWPAPLLVEDNEDLRNTLEEQTIQALAARLAADMRADRESILVAPYLAPFHVDVDAARAYADGSGLHFRGEILVWADSRIENLGGVQIRVGKDKFQVPTRESDIRSTGSRKYRTFLIEWDHPTAPSLPANLGLAIEAETPSLVTRSYTFAIEAPKSGTGSSR